MDRKRRGIRAEAVSAAAGSRRLRGDARARRPMALEVDLLPATMAQTLGTSRRAVEVALWGPLNLAQRCARVIAALKAAGADEALVSFIQPIDLAIHAAQPAAVTNQEMLGAPSISQDEDWTSGTPTREVAQAYLNTLYEDLARRTAQRTAVVGQQAVR
jgi:hypothetical protein